MKDCPTSSVKRGRTLNTSIAIQPVRERADSPRRRPDTDAFHQPALTEAIPLMRIDPGAALDWDVLARTACLSRCHFLRVFEEVTAVTATSKHAPVARFLAGQCILTQGRLPLPHRKACLPATAFPDSATSSITCFLITMLIESSAILPSAESLSASSRARKPGSFDCHLKSVEA